MHSLISYIFLKFFWNAEAELQSQKIEKHENGTDQYRHEHEM